MRSSLRVGLKFLENRDNPDAFEPVPGTEAEPEASEAAAPAAAGGGPESYQVEVNGVAYNVKVTPGGAVTDVRPTVAAPAAAVAAPEVAADGIPIVAPLAGNIFKIKVVEGQSIAAGEVVMVLEAMKMETEVRASVAGIIGNITVKEGDAVQVGETLLRLA